MTVSRVTDTRLRRKRPTQARRNGSVAGVKTGRRNQFALDFRHLCKAKLPEPVLVAFGKLLSQFRHKLFDKFARIVGLRGDRPQRVQRQALKDAKADEELFERVGLIHIRSPSDRASAIFDAYLAFDRQPLRRSATSTPRFARAVSTIGEAR